MQRNLIIALIGIILIVVFALQNSDPMNVKLIFWNFESTESLILTVFFFLGAILGILFSIPTILKKNKIIAELKEVNTGEVEEKVN